jgi:ubiquinone/menaquinone biosynthesis C-methylase UbiE
MKEYFKDFFSGRQQVDEWMSKYSRPNFLSECYRMRMARVLDFLKLAKLPEGAWLLDAGCGPGLAAQESAQRMHHTVGMDYSFEMIKKSKTFASCGDHENPAFIQGDVESLPFKDSSLDLILCVGVLTYLRTEVRTLQEFFRALNPHGTIILSILNRTHLAAYLDFPSVIGRLLRKTWKKIRPAGGEKAGTESGRPRLHRYFFPSFQRTLLHQGFQVLDYTTVPFGLLTFFGREIPPRKWNMKMTLFFEKFLNVPLVGPLGGMCIIHARKDAQ